MTYCLSSARLSGFLIDRVQPTGQMRALVSGEVYEAVMETDSDRAVALLLAEATRRGYVTDELWDERQWAVVTWRSDDDSWCEHSVPTEKAWLWWRDAAEMRPTPTT